MIKTIPLDYSKVENWIINENGKIDKKYDLIFFCGTSILDPALENGVGNNFEQMRKLGYTNYKMCGEQLSEDARVFCPVQRQVSLKYALSKYDNHEEILKDIATKEPYVDLAAALDYYFEHYNKDGSRPFVLAGHSQGAASLQVAITKYFLFTEKKKYLKNMIAAYALGYGVSKKRWEEVPNKEGLIHFATGEDDYNCLLSWNTEGPGEKGRSFLLCDEDYDTLLINPLNWKTDETLASINENLGVLATNGDFTKGNVTYSISNDPKDLLDAKIDLKRGSIICTTKTDYMAFPDQKEPLWGGKSLHGYDGKGYYNNIKQNLKVRVAHFLKHNSK